MAIPSGSGTEVLRRGSINDLEAQATHFDFSGAAETTANQTTNVVPAHHIITIISIIFYGKENVTNGIDLKLKNGTNYIQILEHTLPYEDTFIFSDKIVLHPGDALQVTPASNHDVDIWYSYIDQDWS